MNSIFLFGPFIGSLEWEMLYFAPFCIYTKRKNPKSQIAVFTRPERFDLYGRYVDFLIPLYFDDNNSEMFRDTEITNDEYIKMSEKFKSKYSGKFKIENHFFPRIHSFNYKVKWQFPRSKMLYDFLPRRDNEAFIHDTLKYDKKNIFIDFDAIKKISILDKVFEVMFKENNERFIINSSENVNIKRKNIQISKIQESKNLTKLGCIIESLKLSSLSIGNLNSDITKLSLLLKKPTILINEKCTNDQISLINPMKTKIFRRTF